MSKIALILTNDWELYGDGSGDYFEVQHKPLENTLELLRKYGANISVMAEVLQQLTFKDFGVEHHFAREASQAWEDIIRSTVRQGSDVQLHLHPQWKDAEFGNGRWKLSMRYWKLSSLSEMNIIALMLKGKNYLESLLKPQDHLYRCTFFRAGNYCLQPSDKVIRAMKAAGLKYDTSVTKGLKSDRFYDFRKAHSNILPWHTDSEDINKPGEKGRGVIEFPIYSESSGDSPALRKFSPGLYYKLKYGTSIPHNELEWLKKKDEVKNSRYPRENRFYKQNIKKSPKFYLDSIYSKNVTQLDYDQLPATAFIKMLKNILNNKSNHKLFEKGNVLPVIASGHMKDIHNTDNIRLILEGIDKELRPDVTYQTLSEAAEYWESGAYELKNDITKAEK